MSASKTDPSILLVHGGFVDGSGWQPVYSLLRKQGLNVAIVQNPTITLADDVAFTKRLIAAQPGKVILVGHSYGGVVITEAGNDPRVAGLVYITAFAPDATKLIVQTTASSSWNDVIASANPATPNAFSTNGGGVVASARCRRRRSVAAMARSFDDALLLVIACASGLVRAGGGDDTVSPLSEDSVDRSSPGGGSADGCPARGAWPR